MLLIDTMVVAVTFFCQVHWYARGLLQWRCANVTFGDDGFLIAATAPWYWQNRIHIFKVWKRYSLYYNHLNIICTYIIIMLHLSLYVHFRRVPKLLLTIILFVSIHQFLLTKNRKTENVYTVCYSVKQSIWEVKINI